MFTRKTHAEWEQSCFQVWCSAQDMTRISSLQDSHKDTRDADQQRPAADLWVTEVRVDSLRNTLKLAEPEAVDCLGML